MNKPVYEYILEIAKEGSFSKAANNLYISQPSLSRTIINLENKLGVEIFDRSKINIQLTIAGEKLVEYIQKSNALEKEFLSEIELIKCSKNQEINIGVISWKVPIFLPKIIPDFKTNFPNIKVNLTIDDSLSLENMLEKDELDVAIINGPVYNKNLEYRKLYSSNIIVMTNNNSNIFKEQLKTNNKISDKNLNLKDFENETFVILKADFRLGQIARNIFHNYNINPKNILEVANVNLAINMISIGMGISFIPDSFVKNNIIEDQNLCFFSLDKRDFELPLVVTYKKKKSNYASIKNFINFVYENYKL